MKTVEIEWDGHSEYRLVPESELDTKIILDLVRKEIEQSPKAWVVKIASSDVDAEGYIKLALMPRMQSRVQSLRNPYTVYEQGCLHLLCNGSIRIYYSERAIIDMHLKYMEETEHGEESN